MVNVRVAISRKWFGVWVVNGTKLEGPNASYYEKALYFVISKSNVSYVPYDAVYGHKCFSNGTCEGILNDLQQGLIDLSMTRFNYDLLGAVGPNLTTTVQEEEYCNVIYKQNITEVHSSSAFFEFLTQFDLDVWLPFTILITIFSLIFFIISIRQSKQSIFKVIWHHCEYLLYQNFGSFENLHKKWLYIIYIVTLLIVSKLLSSTLQIGLTINTKAIKLESYRDMVESGYQVTMTPSTCKIILEDSLDPYAKLIYKRYEAEIEQIATEEQYDEEQEESDEEEEESDEKENSTISYTTSNPLLGYYLSLSKDNVVTLAESGIYSFLKQAGCTFAIEQEMRAPLIHKHISKMFAGYLMSKRSSPSVRKLIFNGYYTLFETGGTIEKLRSLPLSNIHASASCMDKEETPNEESRTVPLNLQFFRYPFIIFISQIIISIIFFLLQFAF